MIVTKNERTTIQWVKGEKKIKIHQRGKNKRTKGKMEKIFSCRRPSHSILGYYERKKNKKNSALFCFTRCQSCCFGTTAKISLVLRLKHIEVKNFLKVKNYKQGDT
jgi:hypothetical protein